MNYPVEAVKINELEQLGLLFKAEDNERFIRERSARIAKGDATIYAVKHDDRPIAEVTIVYNNEQYEDYTIPKKRVYMEALRVLDEYQGKGIGQRLLEEVIKKVKSQGYSEITIGVEDDNEVAKHIYSKLGFNEFIRRDHGDEYDPCDYNVYLKRL